MEGKINITLEEYKELLQIKGKYEELKENTRMNTWYKKDDGFNGLIRSEKITL